MKLLTIEWIPNSRSSSHGGSTTLYSQQTTLIVGVRGTRNPLSDRAETASGSRRS
ncbi:hypothetical protein M413DRAFT_447707 [Hebeloma cylindrosporum]|uniref:Uncharacterized protein n=1 Tax=Hebeloma cylindrosporum TaxID=76867 RepID=A0A0C3C5A7_HEBCY|nr:hypothetical protein M413DRAFT_447707 [Hebeloma cylindrosporum h7]